MLELHSWCSAGEAFVPDGGLIAEERLCGGLLFSVLQGSFVAIKDT